MTYLHRKFKDKANCCKPLYLFKVKQEKASYQVSLCGVVANVLGFDIIVS